ncbi:MAG: HD domain-containing protein [Clostridia bacterium]|nr:HD domain-containing protein [Clostridia bacterium]
MKIAVPENVNRIIGQLEAAGYPAYAVGGCIRDSLMGITPHDWDICTAAVPEKVLEILGKHNVIESGLKHGTVTVKYSGELYEITTFRTDGEYLDNRRPESVTFVRSLKEDLKRRDFTVNAIAYNEAKGLCDYFGGKEDIRNKLIRCVGDPDKRFNEDALRIFRALRFAARFGFEIEEQTAFSVRKNAHLLCNISAERIASELLQIIDGEYAEAVLLSYSDVLGIIIPEILPMVGLNQRNPHHIYDVWGHTVKVIVNSPHGKMMRLAALLHDIAKPECFFTDEKGTGHFHGHPEMGAKMAEAIMRRLKLDNKTIESVSILIRYHDLRPQANGKNVRRMISKIGCEAFENLMELKRADARGQNPDKLAEKLAYIHRLEEIYQEVTANGDEFNLKSLKINGNDLIQMGITEGKQIGKILNQLLSEVIDGTIENDREMLLLKAKQLV